MKTSRRHFLCAASAALLAGASSVVSAQVKWNMPTAYADGAFHTQNIRTFADDVKQASGGKLDITVHSGASLYKLPEIKRAVQTGQVQIGEVLVSALTNEDAMFELSSVPFLAQGFDQVRALYSGAKPFMEKRLERDGVKLLYAVPWPSVGVFLKTKPTVTAELKGHKIRTYDKGTAKFVELVGSTPTTIQAAEIPQAFSTGIIDGMITSTSTANDTKAWEYVNVYYDAKISYPMNMVFVNERAFKSLDSGAQSSLLEAAKKAEQRGWERAQKLATEMDAKVAEKGIQVLQPTAAMQAEFKEIGRKLAAEWAARAGPDGADVLKKVKQ